MGELEKHVRIFNLIAPVYNWFFQGQVKNYRSVLEQHISHLNLPRGSKVLDIGCGTGAFLFCFNELGYETVGVDFSTKMLKAAKKTNQGLPIKFLQGDVTKGLEFPDKSFDLVMASYVLHGLSDTLREYIYKESSRLSRNQVMFYDYNQKRSLVTDIVEWAEGGDYFSFVKQGEREMREFFAQVNRVDVGPRSAMYICSP